jgi:ACS family hexuronate transporter-like MFS transporter
MTLVSLISYVDRNTLALLAPTMLADLKLSGEQYGWVLSGFSLAYMLSNLAWGAWIDRYGLRWMMVLAVGMWSVASALHGLAAGFVSLLAVRTALGFGEGATFPGGLRTVVQTLQPAQRARGTAVAYSGGSLGAIVTPLLMTPVFAAFGWRGAFLFTGLIGLAWILIWLVLSRQPRLRRLPEMDSVSRPQPHWSDPRFWSFICIYAFGALPLGFVLYYAPLYLKVLGRTQLEMGWLLWIPPMGWEAGYFFWGWWTDRAVARAGGPRTAYRRLLRLLAILSLPLAAVPYLSWLPLIMTILFFGMFIAAGFIIAGVSYATTAFGSRDSAFLAGLGAGSWSALMAVFTPLAGRLFDQKQYAAAFAIAVLFPIAGWLLWMALRGRGPDTLEQHD